MHCFRVTTASLPCREGNECAREFVRRLPDIEPGVLIGVSPNRSKKTTNAVIEVDRTLGVRGINALQIQFSSPYLIGSRRNFFIVG